MGSGPAPTVTASVSPSPVSSAPSLPSLPFARLPQRHLQTPEDIAGFRARRRVRPPGDADLGQRRGLAGQAVVLQEHGRQRRRHQARHHPEGQHCSHTARPARRSARGSGSGRPLGLGRGAYRAALERRRWHLRLPGRLPLAAACSSGCGLLK